MVIIATILTLALLKKEVWEYVVSDTQRSKAKCIITATSLKIEAL